MRRRNVECVQLVLVLHWGPFYPHLDFFFFFFTPTLLSTGRLNKRHEPIV